MKLVILDRDGVINFDSEKHIRSKQEWVPISVMPNTFRMPAINYVQSCRN